MVKRALLIGCNYQAVPQARLYGCINDIVAVRNVLVDAYGYPVNNIVLLRDDVPANKAALPTRANILAAMDAVLTASNNANDEVWIHYSGHGTQVRDTNGDEPDGADEAIVPCDFTTAGMITDDTLFDLLNQKAKCRVLLFFDSCHSGSVCDLQYNRNFQNGTVVSSVLPNRAISRNPNITLLSGCRDPQTSADTYSAVQALGVGAFTNALLECLRKNDHNVDIKKLHVDVCVYLQSSGYDQVPALSSSASVPAYSFVRNNIAQTLRLPTPVRPAPSFVSQTVFAPVKPMQFTTPPNKKTVPPPASTPKTVHMMTSVMHDVLSLQQRLQ
jgi:hypothetical protein